jgi:1-acyl-sn-glycerol-3-phosphate acyltransferase
MKIFKEIFARIWALWTLLMFVGTLLIFLVPFFIFIYPAKDPEKTKRLIPASKIWIRVFLFLVACPLRVRGKENFKAGENYIVLCNHNSLMDVPISSPFIPGPNKTIAKIEMSRIPVFGPLYRSGSVLVDRKSDASRKESLAKMKEVLQMGLHMCIYPEGTRNKTKEPLKSFHRGAFSLSLETGKRIIPALIFNTKKVLPADKPFYCLPHPLAFHFLPPVDILPGDTVDSLRERVFEMMKEHYVSREKAEEVNSER